MLRNRLGRQDKLRREETSRALLGKIARFETYGDASPREVEERLRNMSYGSTNSRVAKLRGEAEPAPTG